MARMAKTERVYAYIHFFNQGSVTVIRQLFSFQTCNFPLSTYADKYHTWIIYVFVNVNLILMEPNNEQPLTPVQRHTNLQIHAVWQGSILLAHHLQVYILMSIDKQYISILHRDIKVKHIMFKKCQWYISTYPALTETNQYLPLKSNIVARNVSTLNIWPLNGTTIFRTVTWLF